MNNFPLFNKNFGENTLVNRAEKAISGIYDNGIIAPMRVLKRRKRLPKEIKFKTKEKVLEHQNWVGP